MYRYLSTNNKTLMNAVMETSNIHSRETAFDPLNYEFDAETMIEPFTYFHNGPTESRRKLNEFSSTHFSWLPSGISSPDESPPSYYSPIVNDQVKHPQNNSQQQTPQQQQSQQYSYPKTICTHCKSHNMPECLYTSHSMYDESGAIFCPVLKKCHCATCIRVINTNVIRDDDSDDDNYIRLTSITNEFSPLYGIYPRQNSYHMNNNNNF